MVEQITEPALLPAPENGELSVVIGEFGRHLDMLAEQLGASLSDADRDCVSVGQSFHDLADQTRQTHQAHVTSQPSPLPPPTRRAR